MSKTMLDNEITLTKFLYIYFGIAPIVAKNITHQDMKKLIPDVRCLGDKEFWAKYGYEELCNKELCNNYIKVTDKNNNIMYYNKNDIDSSLVMPLPENDDPTFENPSEIEYLAIELCDTDITKLNPRQLCELKDYLKKVKKYSGKIIDKKIATVQKQLRKIKKER